MKNKCLLSQREAAYELGIFVKTVHRWDQAGKLHTVRAAGNQRRIPIEEIDRLRRQGRGEREAERCVLYTRVSSMRQAQDGNLVWQTERLVRFGFRYLEHAFRWKGVRLEVLDPLKQEPTETLVQDLLTMVSVFAGRLYGHRAKRVRERGKTALKACDQGEQQEPR